MFYLKASPLPPAPLLATGNCRQVGCWNGLPFIAKTYILETLRLHFGTLSDHFGDPGVHRDTQQAPRGPGLYFYWFGDAFGESPGTHFGDISVIFLWFGVAKWETVSRPMFLMILGWKYCMNAVAACVRNIVKSMVFEWVLFFHLFTNLVT